MVNKALIAGGSGAVVVIVAIVTTVLVLVWPSCPSVGYDPTYPLTPALEIMNDANETLVVYKIATIADLDKLSIDKNGKSFHSFLLEGNLTLNAETLATSVTWDQTEEKLESGFAAGGRGMELSELQVYNLKLIACGDKTGILYQVDPSEKSNQPIPWVVLVDGDGVSSSKGFKGEWMTVKDQKLWVGSHGSDTEKNGEVTDQSQQWIKIVSPDGHVEHVNWRSKYQAMRNATGTEAPGYLIHEAAVWSDIHQKWFFLPRKSSNTSYNANDDQLKKGANILISADEDFTEITVKEVNDPNGKLGFSSFKFIPGTEDKLILAIRTMELGSQQHTFVTVFDIDGNVQLPDKPVGNAEKFEGIEFI